jgi:hypothetical protein
MVAEPNSLVPLKYVTLLIVSSVEEAVADRDIVAGPISDVPLFGAATRVTVGAGSCVTVRATAEDVAVRPFASFATAVIE